MLYAWVSCRMVSEKGKNISKVRLRNLLKASSQIKQIEIFDFLLGRIFSYQQFLILIITLKVDCVPLRSH